MIQHIEAINLKCFPCNESHLIIHVFSRKSGKLSLFAKGARQTKSPTKGKLLSFMHNTYIVSQKKGMGTISGIDNHHTFYDLLQDLDKLNIAYECLHLCYSIIQEHHPNETLFDLLLETLKQIENAPTSGLQIHLKDFKRKLVSIEGLLPGKNPADRVIEQTLQQYTERVPLRLAK